MDIAEGECSVDGSSAATLSSENLITSSESEFTASSGGEDVFELYE